MNKVQHTFKMSNGKECVIAEPKVKHIWAGMAKFNFRDLLRKAEMERMGENYVFTEYYPDVVAYIMRELLTIEGQQPTFEEMGEMSIDDNREINAFCEVFFDQLNVNG